MCLSRSGYYAWLKRPECTRAQENKCLTEQIKAVHKKSNETYGSPRIYQELKRQGFAASEKRIARLMHACEITALTPKRFKVTTDSNHALPVAENVLARQFSSKVPNACWSADITYIWTGEGWLYLAVVLDLFSRKVVGWSMARTLERSLVLTALEMALTGRHPEGNLLCHSDRGSQYASIEYQARLKEAGITCSMSRKGNCWDNAPTESFFASLKKELIYRRRFNTTQQARNEIFGWIETWYNRKRRHSALDYLSPEAFEQRHKQRLASLNTPLT